MVMSRYYNPYYNPRGMGGGMAAFLVRQQEDRAPISQSGQYYQPDRRRQTQTPLDIYVPPQQNEVYYPQQPDNSIGFSTEATEIAESTELATTAKAVVPEITEPEVPEVEDVEPAPKSRKNAPKKKPTKKPIEDESDEYDDAPKMPAGAFFPMFFGWGGRAGGAPGGPMAVANAYSTGRGGVATSHATAYGSPRPDERYYNNNYEKNN